MKKIIAVCLATLLVFSLFACADTTSGSNTPTPSDASLSTASPDTLSPSAETPAALDPDSVGLYDAERDYFARDPYKVMYLSYNCGSFGAVIDDNFEGWAQLLNLDYAHMDTASMDDFYTNLQVYADQGYDGFILDGDPSTGERTVELTKELGIKSWLAATSALKNADDSMMWPGVTLDSISIGEQQVQWLFENYQNYFGKIDTKELGLIAVDFSVIPNLHYSAVGAEAKFKELFPDIYPTNFIVADATALGTFTSDTAYNLVSTTMSGRTDIKYWMVITCFEDYGTGAARAQEALGYTNKNAITLSINGDSLYKSWDTGYDGCWVAAVCSPMKMFTGPIMNGLVAMMDGSVTPETIWPGWVADGSKYAEHKIKTSVLTKDTYKAFLAEVDKYAPY